MQHCHYNCYPLLLLQLLPATTVIVTYCYYWHCKVREESFVRQRWKLTSVFVLLPLLLLLYPQNALKPPNQANQVNKLSNHTNWMTQRETWQPKQQWNKKPRQLKHPNYTNEAKYNRFYLFLLQKGRLQKTDSRTSFSREVRGTFSINKILLSFPQILSTTEKFL